MPPFDLIIDDQVRELVASIEQRGGEQELRALIRKLADNCASPAVIARYKEYSNYSSPLSAYPIVAGYAKSFNPLTDEVALVDHWFRFGVVVSHNVVSGIDCRSTIARLNKMVRTISNGQCKLKKPATWDKIPVDDNGVPLLSRGFLEIYHDDSLANLRQALRVYLHHVLIWGRHDLWTTFDRFGVKLPGHGDSKALPLHVDQNPHVHPDFRTVQGVLALTDCPVKRGTFVAVPGSKSEFHNYAFMAKNLGEYIELDLYDPVSDQLQRNAQKIPIREGSIVSWDSRTTHANSANLSDEARMVAYISAGPANETNESAVTARADAFRTGIGSNVRDALMHASKKPRYSNQEAVARARTPEQLTTLGKLLYGQLSYGEI